MSLFDPEGGNFPTDQQIQGWNEHNDHADDHAPEDEPLPVAVTFPNGMRMLEAIANLPVPPKPGGTVYWNDPPRPRIPTIPYPELALPVAREGRALGRCEGCGAPMKLPGMGTMDQPYAVPQHVCTTMDACSFCGATPSPQRPIVMGPGVGICTDCVQLAQAALEDQEGGR